MNTALREVVRRWAAVEFGALASSGIFAELRKDALLKTEATG